MSLLLSKSLSYLPLSLYVFQYDYDNDYSFLYGIALCYILYVVFFPLLIAPIITTFTNYSIYCNIVFMAPILLYYSSV